MTDKCYEFALRVIYLCASYSFSEYIMIMIIILYNNRCFLNIYNNFLGNWSRILMYTSILFTQRPWRNITPVWNRTWEEKWVAASMSIAERMHAVTSSVRWDFYVYKFIHAHHCFNLCGQTHRWMCSTRPLLFIWAHLHIIIFNSNFGKLISFHIN
jgi:hypothetical protein